MKRSSLLLLFSGLLLHALAGAAENIQSRFDAGLDGWSLAPSSQAGTSVRQIATGGDPGGHAAVAALVDAAGIVTTLADSGPGSLRALLANPAVATITFDPALSGQTIVLGGTQILIARDVTIDASALADGIAISGNSNGDDILDPGESRIFEISLESSVTLRALQLINGHSEGGGAILSYGDLVLEDCVLTGNRGGDGGALRLLPESNTVIHRSLITDNHAVFEGGAIHAVVGSLTIYDSTISNNSAQTGGGLDLENDSTLYRTTISGNEAVDFGGGINNGSNLTLIQCTLSGNTAGTGAAILNGGTSELIHTTITSNTAAIEGGGIAHVFFSLALTHSIVAGNTAPSDPNLSGISTGKTITHSLITGDPMLAPLGDYGGPTETMPPLAGSPAIDEAVALATPLSTDQRGFLRGRDTAPDIGAVEVGPAPGIHRVDASATGANDGTSWADAYTDLAAALAAAEPGDELWVAAGVYTPGDARTDTFQLRNHIAIYGGFTGSETTRAQRNPDPLTNATVLSGDIGVPGDFSDNVYHVVNATGTNATALLSGFTITGGYANAPGTDMPSRGAGLITTLAGSPTLEDLRFIDNVAAYVGGAVYLNASSPTFTRVVFADNATTAERSGTVNGFGGAIYTNTGSPVFIDCQFLGNSSPTGGGAIHTQTGAPTFINCLFAENTAGTNGGAVQVVNSSPTFINTTVSANTAEAVGGGLHHTGTGTTTLTNSIVWGNTDTSGTGTGTAAANLSATSPALQYSLVEGHNLGGTNLDGTLPANAPAFIDAALGDFRLSAASPARNFGNNSANPRHTDLAGQARIQGGTIDLGVYEGARNLQVELAAPARYLGDRSAHGGGVFFLSRHRAGYVDAPPASGGALLLTGGGVALRFDLPLLAPAEWSRNAVPLKADAGWVKVSGGDAPTPGEFATALADVTALHLSFPLRAAIETIGFDNLDLFPTPPAPVYFRFGDNPDSPGIFLETQNGDPLTAIGTSVYALPVSGPGSAFPNPVSRPGLLNTQAADFGLAGAYDAGRMLFVTDSAPPPWGPTLTVEAFIHAASLDDTNERIIAAHGSINGGGSSQPAWSLGVDPAGVLVFRANASGSPAADVVLASNLTIEPGRDYYVAVTFDAGTVTFFLQDLEAGTDLVSEVATPVDIGLATPTRLFAPAAPFLIGNLATGDRAWHGLIDEVRISYEVVAEDDLITAPFDTSAGRVAFQFFGSGQNLDLSELGGTANFLHSILSSHLWQDNYNPNRLDYDPLSRVAYRLDMPGIVGGGVNDLIRIRYYEAEFLSNINSFMVDIAPGPNFGAGTFRLVETDSADHRMNVNLTDARIGDVPEGFSYELVRNSETDRFTELDMVVRPARTLSEPIIAASDADIAETDLDLGFKGGSLRLTESFSSSERRLFIHEGHDAVIEVDADKTVDWNATTLNYGRLIKRGDGALNFPGGIAHRGHIQFDGGLVTGPLTNDFAFSSFLSFNGGAYRFEQDLNFQTPMHIGPEGGTLDISTGRTVRTTNVGLTGTGPVTKNGEGTFRTTLNESSTHQYIVNDGTLELNFPDNRSLEGLGGTGGVVQLITPTPQSEADRKTLTLTDSLDFEGTLDLGYAHLRIESGDNPPLIGSGSLVGKPSGGLGQSYMTLDSSADFTFNKNFTGNVLNLSKYGAGTMNLSAGLDFPIYTSWGEHERIWINVRGGRVIIPNDFAPYGVILYPDTELVIEQNYMGLLRAEGGTVRFGPGFKTVRFIDEDLSDSTRVVFKLSRPGVAGQGVNDLMVRGWWKHFRPIFDIEAHPGFGPGNYPLVVDGTVSQLGFHLENWSLGNTPEEYNYSYALEVERTYIPAFDSMEPTSIHLIVTANPVSYADWVAEYDWDGADSSPLADPLGRGMSNLLAYFHGIDPLGAVPAERFTFSSKEVIDDQPYWVIRLRKNHHFDEGTATWSILSSDTLEAESWQTHAPEDILTEWVGLSDDGNATLYDLKIPADESTRKFFRIAVDLETPQD